MSPIVYMPPRSHDCKPPKQGQYLHLTAVMYPEYTIWECDDCGDQWELEYKRGFYFVEEDRLSGREKKNPAVEVIWNRLAEEEKWGFR